MIPRLNEWLTKDVLGQAFLHLARGLFYGSYFYNPSTWFSGIVLLFFLMAIAFLGYVLPFGQMSFWGATVITNLLSPIPGIVEWVCGGYCVNSPNIITRPGGPLPQSLPPGRFY